MMMLRVAALLCAVLALTHAQKKTFEVCVFQTPDCSGPAQCSGNFVRTSCGRKPVLGLGVRATCGPARKIFLYDNAQCSGSSDPIPTAKGECATVQFQGRTLSVVNTCARGMTNSPPPLPPTSEPTVAETNEPTNAPSSSQSTTPQVPSPLIVTPSATETSSLQSPVPSESPAKDAPEESKEPVSSPSELGVSPTATSPVPSATPVLVRPTNSEAPTPSTSSLPVSSTSTDATATTASTSSPAPAETSTSSPNPSPDSIPSPENKTEAPASSETPVPPSQSPTKAPTPSPTPEADETSVPSPASTPSPIAIPVTVTPTISPSSVPEPSSVPVTATPPLSSASPPSTIFLPVTQSSSPTPEATESPSTLPVQPSSFPSSVPVQSSIASSDVDLSAGESSTPFPSASGSSDPLPSDIQLPGAFTPAATVPIATPGSNDGPESIDDGSVCFDADSTVLLADGSRKTLSSVAAGDMVESVNDMGGRIFEEVFLVQHTGVSKTVRMLDIVVDKGHVRVTPGHYIRIPGSSETYSAARNLAVGDKVFVSGDNGMVEQEIRAIIAQRGAPRNIHTMNDRIVVDGVVASCVSANPVLGLDTMQIKSLLTPLKLLHRLGFSKTVSFVDMTIYRSYNALVSV